MDICSGAVSGQARPIVNERRSGLLTIHQKTLKLEPKGTGFVLMWGLARKVDCVAPLGLSAENCRNPGLAPWATVYRSLRELIQPRSGVTS